MLCVYSVQCFKVVCYYFLYLGDPCENYGVCIPGSSKTCRCLAGFSGELCEVNINDCTENMCQNGGNVEKAFIRVHTVLKCA